MEILVRKWLNKNTRLWFLVARQIFNIKLDPRKRDRNSKMSNFFLNRISIACLTFFLIFLVLRDSGYTVGNKWILLVKEWNFCFDDFTSLKRLANDCLISIDCHIPFIFNFFKTIVNHSASTCFWSYLDKTNFFFRIFFWNQFSLELSFRSRINLPVFRKILWRKWWIFTLSAWWRNIFFLRSFLVGVALGFPDWCGLRTHFELFLRLIFNNLL